jgi:N-terminal domain of anti-restriction factor ArdC
MTEIGSPTPLGKERLRVAVTPISYDSRAHLRRPRASLIPADGDSKTKERHIMTTSHTGNVNSARRDPMQEFADRIITELERGVKPWVRPWDPEKAGGPQAPFNPVTGKRYHGINVLILGMDMRAFQTATRAG